MDIIFPLSFACIMHDIVCVSVHYTKHLSIEEIDSITPGLKKELRSQKLDTVEESKSRVARNSINL